jgi:hypothetical protein
MKAKLEHPNKSHPGRAGRKPAPLPFHLKKLRASDKDWQEFMSYLTGDAAMDFLIILVALRMYDETHKGTNDR